MRTAALSEGRDHDTSLPGAGAVALTVLLAAFAAAQHAAAQSAPCTAIENDAERLACYDRALRGDSPAPAATAPAAQAPVAPAQAPTASAPHASTPPAPAASAAPASAMEADVVPIVIVSVRTLPGRETTFTTQDGRTWVQTDSQRIYGLPDTPFNAEIKPGAVGSKFLVPKDGGRAIRVKLVQR